MRALLPTFLAFFLVVGISHGAHAQTNAAPSNPQLDREKAALLSFLTPQQQDQYAKAREKALKDNPDLKAEGKAVVEQGLAVRNSEDEQAFREKMISHRQKLREAMLKEDGTLGPIFAEIDKHISEMKAKHLGQVQSSTNSSTAPNPAP